MAYEKIAGIYCIYSKTKTDRVYIGSSISLLSRKVDHWFLLRHDKHHSVKLQKHFNKYGENDLVFEVLESGIYLCKNHLLSREQMWFDRFSFNGCKTPYFNILPTTGSCLGRIVTQEHRDNLSKANKGKRRTEEDRKRMSERQKGKKRNRGNWVMSQEQKDNHSRKMKGRTAWNKGVPLTAEWIEKISKKRKGKPSPRKGIKTGYIPRSAFKKGLVPWNKGKKGINIGIHCKIILQYDKSGNFIREWGSVKEASETMKISPYTIGRMCRGYIYKKVNLDFIFKYKKDVI